MKYENKSKSQLINEIKKLHQKISKLEMTEAERKQAEEVKLRLAAIVEDSDDAIIGVTLDGIIISWNKGAKMVYGYSAQEVLGKPISILACPDYKDEVPEIFERVKRGEYIEHFETVRLRKDGQRLNISLSISPIKDAKGKITGISTIARDLTKRKKLEEKIKHLNLVLRAIRTVNQLITREKNRNKLIQGACDRLIKTRGYWHAWIALLDDSGKFVTSAETGLGRDFLPMVERFKRNQLPECGQKALTQSDVLTVKDPLSTCKDCPLSEKYAGRGAMTIRLEHRGKIYGLLSVCIATGFLLGKEEKSLFREVAGDISYALRSFKLEEERKQAEEKIKDSLKEKEVLLQEIHHRVKNNMQIMSSLLRLQSASVKDEKIRDMFNTSQSRIKTMSLVHEKLYGSADLASIDFSDYVKKLTTHLLAMYSEEARGVNLKVDVKDIFLDINSAIPCGLIINELVSNSLKHAFPKEKGGSVEVKMSKDKKGKHTLMVKDTGTGLSEDVDLRKPQKLGLQIVTDLTKQLGGTVKLRREEGTKFIIMF